MVAKSDPDGYTLLVPDVAQLAVNPALFAKIPYDPVEGLCTNQSDWFDSAVHSRAALAAGESACRSW